MDEKEKGSYNENRQEKNSGADLNYIFGEGNQEQSAADAGDKCNNGNQKYGGNINNYNQYNQSLENNLFYVKPGRSYDYGIKIFISVILAVIMFVSGFLVAYTVVPSEEEKLTRWIKSVSDKYFYDVDGSGYSFLAPIGDAMTNSLDQYSRFLFGDSLEKENKENEGIFNDSGLVITKPQGEQYVRALKVYGNSPAYKAGIRAGDVLDKINETSVMDKSYSEVIDIITELKSAGTPITFHFIRNINGEVKTYLDFDYQSEEYRPKFSYYYDNASPEMNGLNLGPDTAYITLEEFSTNADTDFAANLVLFKENNKKNLILDLRTNFGGGLNILREVASHLITDDSGSQKVKIITAEYKSKNRVSVYTEKNDYGSYHFENIVVLANSYSASATEVLICAMKDYGTIDALIGQTTYGKAVMQQYFDYHGKYGMYITVALLYSPITNVTYNTAGFAPDADMDIVYNLGYLAEDNQLKKAVDYINNSNIEIL
jgi:carboxyl-terminal processing protease